jgi:hypothetical protein
MAFIMSACFCKAEPSYQYCHGSTYSALYLMGLLEGEGRNSLVPYGTLEKLKIPTFSGECARGIRDNGINQSQTSWFPIASFELAAQYSRRFPFSIEKAKEKLRELIDYKGLFTPQANTYDSIYWNQIQLRIRQVRAWDEPTFQREMKVGLDRWIVSEIEFINSKRACIMPPLEKSAALDRMMALQRELQEAPAFTLSLKDKEEIEKAYPIVFLCSSKKNVSSPESSMLDEYGIEGNLQLGKEIRAIATEDEFIEEIKGFLKVQGLATKVKVVAIRSIAS